MFRKKSFFAKDVAKYYSISFRERSPNLKEKISFWVSQCGFHCVAIYRFGKFTKRMYNKNRVIGFLPISIHWILRYFVRTVHHVDIDLADFGPGLYIGHASTIYIGALSVGENFSVTHNVTIGIGHSQGKEGCPIIGDNVWIGTGSTVAGAIRIGNNVTIMPGTFLSRDIPDGCLVGGNPARIIYQNYDNKKLFIAI